MFRQIIWAVLLVTLLPCTALAQQVLVEMTASEPKEVLVLDRNPEKAVLVVKSVIGNLSFESSFSDIEVIRKEPGLWHLILEPGTHIITFSAPGFLNLEQRIVYSEGSRAKEIEIKIDPQSLEVARRADRESPVIVHQPVRQATEGDTIRFTARVTDNTGVLHVRLFYRRQGAAAFDTTAFIEVSANEFEAFVAAPAVNLEYYLTATDIFENRPAAARNPRDPYIITVIPKPQPVVALPETPAEEAAQQPGVPSGKKGTPWKWIGIGSAGAGVILYFVLRNGDPPPPDNRLPAPPGDPGNR